MMNAWVVDDLENGPLSLEESRPRNGNASSSIDTRSKASKSLLPDGRVEGLVSVMSGERRKEVGPGPASYKSCDSVLSSSSVRSSLQSRANSSQLIVVLIVVLGLACCATVLAVGIMAAKSQQEQQFNRDALDLVNKVQSQFTQYVSAAALVHNRCRRTDKGSNSTVDNSTQGELPFLEAYCTREDFTDLYEYLVKGTGLDFKAVQYDPYVPHSQRQLYEEAARAYYREHYPHINYTGFRGFEKELSQGLFPRSDQPFYYPIHYMEPILGNEAAIDLDYYSHASRRRTLEAALGDGKPALTDRLVLVKDPDAASRCTEADDASYGVVLMHPGVKLSAETRHTSNTVSAGVWPLDLSSIVICLPSLLRNSVEGEVSKGMSVYVHDVSDSSGTVKFLGGLRVDVLGNGSSLLTFSPEIDLEELSDRSQTSSKINSEGLIYQEHIEVANKVWTISIIANENTYTPAIVFVAIGGVVVFLASVGLAFWVRGNSERSRKFNELKSKAESEKAALILENARQATKAERELNDFIGHEVRNPVAAAIAACSFVKAEVNKENPLSDEDAKTSTREDVAIIDNSLRFVSDLLRNMLDMHRAANKQLDVNFIPTDLLHDVLEPVAGMLQVRQGNVEIIIDCPRNITVMTDSLRLKQVMLNLGRNSSKFVSTGYIRLSAAVVNGEVQLAVDDSGTGIPIDKRKRLFSKFQESLDVLSQGTGVGLFLCKNLIELMGGEIFLDENFDSGVPGFPGTRFVINLKSSPLDDGVTVSSSVHSVGSGTVGRLKNLSPTVAGDTPSSSISNSDDQDYASIPDLPENMSVLFVDDDGILRKLFCRTIKKVAPTWTFREASSGEAALRLIDNGDSFDLIFMDMYMASVEKQLLGTETVAELRARKVDSRICGLSANDLEKEFLVAGADAFLIKPFETDSDKLKKTLHHILTGKKESPEW